LRESPAKAALAECTIPAPQIIRESALKHGSLPFALRPVLPAAFCLVHPRVRFFHRVSQRRASLRRADAERNAQRQVAVRGVVRVQRAVDAVERSLRGSSIRAGQEDGELVAANARDDVFGAERALEQARRALEQRIARRVSVSVVRPLQVIQVCHHDADRKITPAFEPRHFLFEKAPVVQAGQRVLDAQGFELLFHLLAPRNVADA